MRVAHSGRAQISIRRPRGMGECDRCGFWHNLDNMVHQMQWAGNTLIDTGLLVGLDCLDIPQDQYRTPILPPDPLPLINPRPSPNVTPIVYIGQPLSTTPENQGFSQYNVSGQNFVASGLPPMLTQAGVLARLAAISGVPTPPAASLASYIVPMFPQNRAVIVVPSNPVRSFLAIYNPTQFPAQISKGTATQGAITNLSIGPGEAYFWANAQGLASVYQGQVTGIGLYPRLPLWAWEDQAGLVVLYSDAIHGPGGILALVSHPPSYPTDPTGLAPGTIWDNGLAVCVVGVTTPDPTAPPVFFGGVTASGLQQIGGANLPLTNPGDGSLQLWNDGGQVSVA